MASFVKELRDAIKHFLEYGYSSEESLIMWTERDRTGKSAETPSRCESFHAKLP